MNPVHHPSDPPSAAQAHARVLPKPALLEPFLALWQDYPWVTRGATLLLVAAALLNMAVSANDGEALRFGPLRWIPPQVQSACSSDGMLTLLTLAVALGVGLHLKQRQLKGLLDGTDHYDIGRALAFGYFSNFLVAALLLVRIESRKRDRKLVFRMIFPRTIRDLETFKTTVEPAIRQWAGKRELEGVYRSGSCVIKRSMLIVSRTSSDAADGDEIFFDFPTTLYTLHDYYETWNLWLEEHDKPLLADHAIEEMQERQVQAFKRHLIDLSRSTVGLEAVRYLGLTNGEDLAALFEDHFRDVEPQEMLDLLISPEAAPPQGDPPLGNE